MVELTDVTGVSDSRAEDLRDEGFLNVEDIATATVDELSSVKGIGASTAEGLIESAQDVVRGDTLGDEEDEQTQEAVAEEAEQDEEEYEVTEDDLRDLVEEESDGEPSADDVTAEDDTDEPREVDVVVEPPYELSIEVATEEEYDYLFHALLDVRLGSVHVNGPYQSVVADILDQLRSFDGTGTVMLSLSRSELDSLHAALKQCELKVQGVSGNQAFTVIRGLREQVTEYREEYVL